jgi:23S rRNA (cytidine1920-2'-O)/16S rRNA (cytidine1409-2'-O)-methyltransferase
LPSSTLKNVADGNIKKKKRKSTQKKRKNTVRIDKYLVENNLTPSRTYAENLVLKGKVAVDGRVITKPSFDVKEGMSVKIVEDEGYASQGAFKLLEAIKSFNLDLSGKDTADIGCSNGGFTDVLLRNNVRTVVAIDVAECDLPERILNDKRVHFIQQNARDLTLDKLVEFVCSDVSFISLKHVLPTIHRILTKDGEAVVLIKPQFELDKSKLSKKGIVLAEKDRQHAIDLVKTYALQCGFSILGITTSPIFYENKNIEYLLHIKK